MLPVCVCCTVTDTEATSVGASLSWGGCQLPRALPNSESTVLSDVSPTPRLQSRSVLRGRSRPFPLGDKVKSPPRQGGVAVISCGVGLLGDLGLFTQILVEGRLQEAGVGVVLHEAVHPLLGCRKAATRSLLDVLGNERLGLKVYVYLKRSNREKCFIPYSELRWLSLFNV